MSTNVAYGRDILFGFAKETTYNEAWGTPTLSGIYIDPNFDFSPNIETMRIAHNTGKIIASINEIAQGIKNWTLKISGKLPKDGFAWLALALFGKVATTAGVGYYEHVFYPTAKNPCSLKVLLKTPIQGLTYLEWRLAGAKVKAIELTFAINQPVMFSVEFVGGNFETTTATSTVSIPIPAVGTDPFYYFYGASNHKIELGATTDNVWNSLSIRLENELAGDIEDSYAWGSDQRRQLIRAASEHCFKITGTAKRLLTKTSHVDFWKNFTDGTFQSIIDYVGTYYGFSINGSKIKILTHKSTPRGLGLIHEEVGFEFFDDTNTMWIRDTQSAPATQEGD